MRITYITANGHGYNEQSWESHVPKKFEHGSNEHTNQMNCAANKFYEAGIKSVTVVLSSKPLETDE